jgi:hypothetical protein
MNEDAMIRLLTEIRDDQRQLLSVFAARADEARALHAKAEAIQDKSAKLVGSIQRFVPIALFVVIVLIVYVSWLLFRILR